MQHFSDRVSGAARQNRQCEQPCAHDAQSKDRKGETSRDRAQRLGSVAETGSVNRAAIRLNLTQPAVTGRVQSFEAATDSAILLDRRAEPRVTSHWTTWLIEQVRNGALDCAIGL